ncbi:MAG: T9SS type A sorting domain-containing protein [Bacteroidota bacterium]|nr:T9SS type A sorting domain-containing protein [Bacteroidota bacterium]
MMKKITLFSLILAISFGMFAQNMANKTLLERKFVKDNVSIDLVKYDKYNDYQEAIRAYGDTIATEDFSSGGPGVNDLPNGWTSTDFDSQGNNYTWQWTDVGATGPTTGPASAPYDRVLASTTAANGWMILDSDNYGQGSYDSYLYSPTYNCSAFGAVAVTFEELYKRWGNESTNPYGGNPTYVGVSIDGGTTWTEIEIHGSFGVKDETDNPGYYMLNISSIAGSQANVKVYFRMKGLWDYWWQIDDFKVIEGAYNDIKLVEASIASVFDGGTGTFYDFGYYSQMPMAQLTPWVFSANVTNNGIYAQSNVTLHCDVTESGTNVFAGTDDTLTMSFLDSTDLQPAFFTPTVTGHYFVDYLVDQTETEEVPADNVGGPFEWKITDNKIMARDIIYTRALSPSLFTDGSDGDMLAVDYHIAFADTVQSISVFIDYRTDPGNTLIGQIYEFENSAWTVKVETEEYIVTAQDLGTWITLPIVTIDPIDDKLDAHTTYLAGIEFYWGNNENVNLWIGADDEGPHDYQHVTSLRIGSTWYWIHELPMIRLNLASAIEPPVFQTTNGFDPAMLTLCASATQAVSYELDFDVNDPNGLPVTIDTVNTPDFVTIFNDNGNNTYTFGFDFTGVDTSSTVHYLFELIADNGYSQNSLYFWASVEDIAGCEPWAISDEAEFKHINIYPNPTTGILNIENAGNARIYIYNVIGEIVATVDADSAIETIDLNEFAEGTYIVKVVSENDVVSQQINLIK